MQECLWVSKLVYLQIQQPITYLGIIHQRYKVVLRLWTILILVVRIQPLIVIILMEYINQVLLLFIIWLHSHLSPIASIVKKLDD